MIKNLSLENSTNELTNLKSLTREELGSQLEIMQPKKDIRHRLKLFGKYEN